MNCSVLSMTKRLLVAALLSSCQPPALACSPGTGFGQRVRHRKLTPLLRKQYVPNVSEGTIGASGPSEGRIDRGSARFRKLVTSYNPNVEFRDEEENGSDRVMSARCKDRVDTLALLVANRWSGVRLRVDEAWTENSLHPAGSLHYEGRAVDISTTDRDYRKYGMLARLAVEAGFDWVYYEAKTHVHASVRADDSDAAKYGGCFPGDARVTVAGENRTTTTTMSRLRVGDRVLAADRRTGRVELSEVVMLMDRRPDVRGAFVTIGAADRTVTLTPNHLIFVADRRPHASSSVAARWRPQAVYAGDVAIGDHVYVTTMTNNASGLAPAPVTSVTRRQRTGLVAPLTRHGTVVVDGAVASCYAVVSSEPLAHAAFAPVRLLPSARRRSQVASAEDSYGVHWYARLLAWLGSAVLPGSALRLAVGG